MAVNERCQACGQPLGAGATTCAQCGTTSRRTVTAVESGRLPIPSSGAELPPTRPQFDRAVPPAQPVVAGAPTAVVPHHAAPLLEQAQPVGVGGPPGEPPPRRGRTGLAVAGAVIGTAIITAVVVLIVTGRGQRDEPVAAQQTTAAAVASAPPSTKTEVAPALSPQTTTPAPATTPPATSPATEPPAPPTTVAPPTAPAATYGHLGTTSKTPDGGVPGAQVIQVDAGSPAAIAGVQVGDVIVGIDGQPINTYDDLIGAMRARMPGDQILLEVIRGGTRLQLPVTLDAAP